MNLKNLIILFICCLLFFSISCKNDDNVKNEDTTKEEKKEKQEIKPSPLNFTLNDFLKDNDKLNLIVDSIFKSIGSDEERVAQMVITFGGKLGKPEEYVKKIVREKKTGGVLLAGGTKENLQSLITKLKSEVKENKYIPLFFMVDGEPSLVSRKINGSPQFKSAFELSEKENIRTADEITKLIKNLGFNVNLAPVCDFSDNKEIIGKRSYGDKKRIIKLASDFIKESHKQNILAVIKHFPGHGRVKGDSHKELVYLSGSIDEEIKIFKAMIDSGALCVMIGHIAINDGKYSTEGKPATLSRKIVQDLLRNELGFKGLTITDAMNMKAVSELKTPSLNAAIAGIDLILAPSDEGLLISSIVKKMKEDESFKNQIYSSVKRIIRMKVCLGLFN